MSQEPMSARRTIRIARRYKKTVAAAVLAGLIGGLGYAAASPRAFSSQALVVLQPPADSAQNSDPALIAATQEAILTSDPVLSAALASLRSGLPPAVFRSRLTVTSPAPDILSVAASGRTAAISGDNANAVARSYVRFSAENPDLTGHLTAQVLQAAAYAQATSPVTAYGLPGLIGTLAGGVLGLVAALARGRGDRRLRQRGEVANAIGLPVIAAVPVSRAAGVEDWARLLAGYRPAVVDAWRLRVMLENLGIAGRDGRLRADPASIAVVSVAADRKALALGPQLAVFAASLGMPATLLIGPQQDTAAVAALRAAAAADRPPGLRVLTADRDGAVPHPGRGLAVSVLVVDGDAPRLPGLDPSAVTLLGVSAGVLSAEQLARAAAAVADAGSRAAAVLMADPEPDDFTSGLSPQLAGPVQRRLPTRVAGMPAETRR